LVNHRKNRSGTGKSDFQNLFVLPSAAEETSIAVPGEKASHMIAQGKADFHMTVPGQVVFQRTGLAKADFRKTDLAKVGSHRTAPGKEAPARSDPLTENQAQDPAALVMAINLFSVTGKVPGSYRYGFTSVMVFSGIFSHNCTDISANRRR